MCLKSSQDRDPSSLCSLAFSALEGGISVGGAPRSNDRNSARNLLFRARRKGHSTTSCQRFATENLHIWHCLLTECLAPVNVNTLQWTLPTTSAGERCTCTCKYVRWPENKRENAFYSVDTATVAYRVAEYLAQNAAQIARYTPRTAQPNITNQLGPESTVGAILVVVLLQTVTLLHEWKCEPCCSL